MKPTKKQYKYLSIAIFVFIFGIPYVVVSAFAQDKINFFVALLIAGPSYIIAELLIRYSNLPERKKKHNARY